jgi:crotonobetainyl-CoA:carnitine CoA-transferase CaiB-like acyl-CoA transferase
MHDEQVISNDLVVDLEHTTAGTIRMVGPTLRMSETPLEVKSASPGLGEHTDEILTSLGYSPEEVRRFRDDGVTR